MTVYSNGTKTKPRVTGRYGDPRPNGRIHEGTDFDGFSTVHAVTAGTVTWAGFFNNAAGYAVVYEGPDPATGENLEYRHFHISSSDIRVRKGDHVSEGQAIGGMGQTGNATGKCDHVEIRHGRGGKTLNSEAWLDSRVASSSTAAPAFPLPNGYYFGPEGGPAQSVSGYHSHSADLQRYQQRMKDRGWAMLVDGLYGPKGATTPQGNCAEITIAFQKEKGLVPDGLVGPQTWRAAWEAPIT